MVCIDVLSVSMRFHVRFCIYEYIQNCVSATFSKVSLSETARMLHLFVFTFQVSPTALGPISSCRASETIGK